MADLAALAAVPSLGVLDVSKNNIDDETEELLPFLAGALPNLKVLYLKDNPVVERISNYRKRVISALPTLTYLDDRPVFAEERRTAEAWSRGGKAAENEERQKIEQEKKDAHVRNYEAFEKMMADARAEQGAASGAVQGGRITEEKEEGDAAAAEKDESEDDEDGVKAEETKDDEKDALPELEDEDAAVAPIVRPTAKITFTHTPDPAAAAAPAQAQAQPLLSLSSSAATPASIAAAAAAGGGAKKKVLIELVDDDESEAEAKTASTDSSASQLPERALVQQLD